METGSENDDRPGYEGGPSNRDLLKPFLPRIVSFDYNIPRNLFKNKYAPEFIVFEGLDRSFSKDLTFRLGLKSTTNFSPDLKLLVSHYEAVRRHFGMSININSAS